jgi:hypothetical protein
MFEKIKRRALKKRIDQNIKNRDISGINREMKTLGFLVDEMLIPELEIFDGFAMDYGLQPKDVKVFSFQEVKKKIPSLIQNQVNNKDFTWKGEIQNQNAVEFLDKDFDVLVGFYTGKHEFMDLMVSRSNAAFKVGFPGGDERLFDLIIAVDPENLPGFKNELKKYLTVLGKMK